MMRAMAGKRCPMCHRASERQSWQCRCGYEFGQDPDVTRKLLRSQLLNLRIGFVILFTLDLAAAGTAVWSMMFGHPIVLGLGFCLMVLWTVRTGHKIVLTHRSLRSLDRQKAPLPRAVVRQ
jgi:hypothetical protein